MRALLLARSEPPLAWSNYNASGASAGVTFAGTRGDNVVVESAFNDTLQGRQGDDTITGGAGNDSIGGGVGIDTVVYAGAAIYFTFDTPRTGISVRDTSGAEGTDTLMLIVITRNGTNNASIKAELHNIEEIKINAMLPSANNGDGFVNGGTSDGDTIIVGGDFTTACLDYSTIRVRVRPGLTHSSATHVRRT